jgi:Na+/proline symporter
MNPYLILSIIAAYFLVLIAISYFTGKRDDNDTFFLGNKKSPWYIVAFGMIGASLSGVTFVSVPGMVKAGGFSYFQMCLGFTLGYFVIAKVLLPLYYRMNLVSIYQYLDDRFGVQAYKTGSFFFLISRLIGASFRLFLVASIFQMFVFEEMGISFEFTVAITILLIWLYTFRSGIKTIIWTDTLQTSFMLLAVFFTFYWITQKLDWTFGEVWTNIQASDYSRVFFLDDFLDGKHFVKQFIGGFLICITMTGLDQDMMQKNLSCKNLGEAQKNMISFGLVLLLVNFFFLLFGALLYLYAGEQGITAIKDDLFPTIAVSGSTGLGISILFILGLIAAAYSSADSALTSLTTAFSVDFMDIQAMEEKKQKSLRKKVHVAFSILLFLVILAYQNINNKDLINDLFRFAMYTYGPLLGLFSFGMMTKRKLKGKWILPICLLAPVLTYYIDFLAKNYCNFNVGFALILLNALLCILGLWMISKQDEN